MKRRLNLLTLLILFQAAAVAQTVDDARAELRKGNPVEAKRQLETILNKDKNSAEAHYWLGMTLLRRETLDADEAADHMEEAVDLNPNNADYQYGLGAALGTKAQNSNPLKQAWLAPKIKSAFEKAVVLNPKHLQARAGLADFYQMAPGIMGGDDEKAWKEADAILAMDEFMGRAQRARMFQRDKKAVEAEAEWKTLTANLPNEWRAWKNLGYFYLRTNRPDESLTPFRKYVELRPDTADSYDSLAEGFLQKKEYEQAIANLNKALSLDQNFVASMHRLAQTYELLGQKKEAREAYQRVLALDTN
ncbi:MAG: tetratricopeptide repeat protein, partial [Bacteroidota bacterium]